MKWMRPAQLLILALFLMCLESAALADVSLRNGNFYIGYKDVVYTGGLKLKIERVYNSKTIYKGLFGHGWGFEYDAYLVISGDGSIVVHEYGGGAENIFKTEQVNQEEVKTAVATIARAAQESGNILSPVDLENFRQRMLADATFRNDQWKKYRRDKLISRRELRVGTVLRSNRYNLLRIERVPDGYVRTSDNGRMEKFDNQGRLVRISDLNENFIDFGYDKRGSLNLITDNLGHQLKVTVNDRGLVEKIEAVGGKTAIYRYDDKDDLIYSRDVDGHVYEYQYNADHNLTRISYADRTSMEISYYPRYLMQNVRRVKERYGDIKAYSYKWSPQDKDDYTVEVTETIDDTVVSKRLYRYLIGHDERGVEWTRKLITDFEGEITETEYNADGQPLRIKSGAAETTFEYDGTGRLLRKETSTEILEYQYAEKLDRITWVKRTPKGAGGAARWSKFEYDGRGNLIYAENSEGETAKSQYDSLGRVSEFILKDQRRIQFTYNKDSNVTEMRVIRDKEILSIALTYLSDGTVDKVTPSGGAQVGTVIKKAVEEYQSLLLPSKPDSK